MTALVKTCKTLHFHDRLSWRDIGHRVEGVKFIDDRRIVMVFCAPAKNADDIQTPASTTTLLGFNHLPVIKTCALYETPSALNACTIDHGGDGHGHEEAVIRNLMKASGKVRKTSAKSVSYDFSVFRVLDAGVLDVFLLHEILCGRMAAAAAMDAEAVKNRRWACVLFDPEIHDALVITDDRVVWSISDTVPQKILVSVERAGPAEARRLVNKSRRMLKLF